MSQCVSQNFGTFAETAVAMSSVVDPDPVGAASFCRIRIQIGIHGLPIWIVIRIHLNQMSSFIMLFLEHFNILYCQNIENYDTFDAAEEYETMYTGAAVNKR